MLSPKLSIILPCYNAENTISNCLESVFAQTYDEYELIIVDDGSTDHTKQIIQQYEKIHHKTITLVSLSHHGVSNARNFGFSKAKGRYIYFLDADDTLQPNMLKKMLDAIESSKSDVVVCNINFIYDKKIQRPLSLEPGMGGQKDFLLSLIHSAQGYLPNKIYTKSVLQKYHFDTTISICEDLLFNIEIAKNINKIIVLDEYLYNYYQNPTSSTKRSYNERSSTELIADQKIMRIISEQYPDLAVDYAAVLLPSVFRQKYNYRKSQYRNQTLENEFNATINHLDKVMRKAKIQSRLKVLPYKYCYGLVNTLKDVKHGTHGRTK